MQEQGAGQVQLQWTIAPGTYLYRNRIGRKGTVARVEKPRGEVKEDPNFGTVEVYHEVVQGVQAGIRLDAARHPARLRRRRPSYPPVEKDIVLASTGPSAAAPRTRTGRIDDGRRRRPSLQATIADISRPLATFAGLTPPLLRPGHRVGVHALRAAHGAHPRAWWWQWGHPRRGLLPSLAFAGPMAAVYAGMGVLVVGGRRAVAARCRTRGPCCRSPPCSSLALAMFGFYEPATAGVPARPPASKTVREDLSFGAAAMGALSAAPVGPA